MIVQNYFEALINAPCSPTPKSANLLTVAVKVAPDLVAGISDQLPSANIPTTATFGDTPYLGENDTTVALGLVDPMLHSLPAAFLEFSN